MIRVILQNFVIVFDRDIEALGNFGITRITAFGVFDITYRFSNSSLRWAIVWDALGTWTTLYTRELREAP